MNRGKYIFAQLTDFLPRRVFDEIVKNVLRLQSLIHIKENLFAKRSELANHLGQKVYREKGIEGMLIRKGAKQKRAHRISEEIHKGLSERLNDHKKVFVLC